MNNIPNNNLNVNDKLQFFIKKYVNNKNKSIVEDCFKIKDYYSYLAFSVETLHNTKLLSLIPEFFSDNNDFFNDYRNNINKYDVANRVGHSYENYLKLQDAYSTMELMQYIPYCFWDEVKKVVKDKYKNNFDDYFKDIELYFNTFSLRDLLICNCDYKKIKQIEDFINSGLKDNLTLRRKLSNERKRIIWHCQVLLKLVGGNIANGMNNNNYVGKTILKEYKESYKKNQQYIKESRIIGADGKIINLSDVIRTQQQKTAEALNLIKTFEQMAKDRDFNWAFITMTLQPEKHPNPSKGKNSYDGTSPYLSTKLLKTDWNKVRANLLKYGLKSGVDYFGALVLESHKDGCGHLHCLMYFDKKNEGIIRKCFDMAFKNMNDDSFRMNNGKASSASYVFKYINKATASFDPNYDIDNIKDKGEFNAVCNSAFRSYNLARSISYFGIENCLTKFRFLARNLKNLKGSINSRLEQIIKSNDLYSFLKERHFEYVENCYKLTEQGTSKFIGCLIDGMKFFKIFFVKIHKHCDLINESIESAIELTFKLTGLVLVNHNYSSKDEKQKKQRQKIDFNIIKEKIRC